MKLNTPFILDKDSLENLFENIKNAIDKNMTLIRTEDDCYYAQGYGSESLTIEELKEKTNIVDFIKFCKKNSIDYKPYLE